MSSGKFDTKIQAQVLESTLDLLGALEGGEAMSQRGISERLGIALGLTNSLIKRCARKGLLKVREAPARRYAYYVTPKGFAEKGRLTAEYLTSSLQFFGRARDEYIQAMEFCTNRGWSKVALFGASDLAEIAIMAMGTTDQKPVFIVDKFRNDAVFHNIPVVRSIADISSSDQCEAIIITDTRNPQGAFESLRREIDSSRIVSPPMLRVTQLDDCAE